MPRLVLEKGRAGSCSAFFPFATSNAIRSVCRVPSLIIDAVSLGTFLKVAAFLYGRLQLRWLHAHLFVLLSMLVGGLVALANWGIFDGQVPALAGIVVGSGTQLALAGWYFGPRVHTGNDIPIGFVRGAVLSVIAYVMIFAIGVIALAMPTVIDPSVRHL